MEKNPYTFDQKNCRLVKDCERPASVLYGAGALFAYSVYMYNRKIFRVDQNFMNLMGFCAVSVPMSYSYASYFLSSATIEAGLLNNQREQTH